MLYCVSCNCKRFIVSAVEYHEWVVDEDGNFIEDRGCEDSTRGDDFQCEECGAEAASGRSHDDKHFG